MSENKSNDNIAAFNLNMLECFTQIFIMSTSKIPVRWPGQCYGFTLSLIFKYCGGIGLY